ncbi:MAG: hypothetical protein U0W24_21875 [Bacteroidales bacterium]
MATTVNFLPLTDKDRKFLNRKKRKMQLALTLFALIALLFAWLAYLVTGTRGPLVAVAIIIVIPVIAYAYIYTAFVMDDVKKGLKKVVTGIIEEKKVETSTTKDPVSIESQRQTQYYTSYFIIIGGIKYKVDEKIFNEYESGEEIELHLSGSEILLDSSHLNLKSNQEIFEVSLVEEMSVSEYQYFTEIRNQVLKRKALFGFIFGFIGYWVFMFLMIFVLTFWFNQYVDSVTNTLKWSLPLLIIFFIIIINRKEFMALYYDTKQREKLVRIKTVDDKIQSNSVIGQGYYSRKVNNGYFYLVAGKKYFHVEKELFDSIKNGDKIKIELTVYSDIQLNISMI